MPGNPLSDPNWAPQLADTIDRYVGMIRDKATNKVVLVVRGLVFGLVILFTLVATITLSVILGIKLLQRIVNIGGLVDRDSSVWVSYVVLGGLFVAIAGVSDSMYVLLSRAIAARLGTMTRGLRAGRYAAAAMYSGLGLLAATTNHPGRSLR